MISGVVTALAVNTPKGKDLGQFHLLEVLEAVDHPLVLPEQQTMLSLASPFASKKIAKRRTALWHAHYTYIV